MNLYQVSKKMPKNGTFMEELSPYQILIKEVNDGQVLSKWVLDSSNCRYGWGKKMKQPFVITPEARKILLSMIEPYNLNLTKAIEKSSDTIANGGVVIDMDCRNTPIDVPFQESIVHIALDRRRLLESIAMCE